MASVAEEIAQASAAQPVVNSGTSAQHDGEMNEDAEREKALQSESNSLQPMPFATSIRRSRNNGTDEFKSHFPILVLTMSWSDTLR